MKYFVLVFAIFAVAVAQWTPKTKEQYAIDKKECSAAQKLTPSSQAAMFRGLFVKEPTCFYHCMGLKMGIWDDVNGFNIERTYAVLQVDGWEVTLDGLRYCLTPDKKDPDPCKWTSRIVKCMYDNNLVKYKNA